MGASETLLYDLAEHDGIVELRGLTPRDVVEALGLLESVKRLQGQQAHVTRDTLVHTLMSQRRISLTATQTLSQAHRLAAQRDSLLATPVFSYETLQEIRGDSKASSTRTWVARKRERHALFTVMHEGRTLVPAFQLTDDGEPRAELHALLEALLSAELDGWSLWTWLTSPSSFLSGEIPEVVARENAPRALKAALRFAQRPSS